MAYAWWDIYFTCCFCTADRRRSALGHRLGTITTAAVTALILLPLAACGGDDEPDDAATTTDLPTTATTTTTLDPRQQAEADVRAAYDAYWEMVARLGASPDPDDPEIDRLVAGPARDRLVDSLTTMHAQQQRVEVGPLNAHRVVDVVIDGESAVVTDCVIDEGTRVDDVTGERTEFPASEGLLVVTMEYASGAWRVSSLDKPPAAEVEPTCGS